MKTTISLVYHFNRKGQVMKAINSALLTVLFAGTSVAPLWGQAFNSGSDGSYGPLNVTVTTNIQVPPNGIFNCTTINIASGQILRFIKNANNTPVYLLATSNVTVTGTINVSGNNGNNVVGGEGGPGGFNGGNPGSFSLPPGAGHGPGAGLGGANGNTANGAGGASYATIAVGTSTNRGSAYGSALLVPLVGGSGGGGTDGTPGVGGGGGGGAILIASNSRIDVSGVINADGASIVGGAFNAGSGGAIRLVAPVVAGNGQVRLLGAYGNGYGGNGRIRIDTLNRTGIAFIFAPAATTSIGSMMMVFPTPLPRLDITEAAGTAIPVGSGPVFVLLPFGSTTNRTVKVQASNFNDLVPIRVVLTPDNGTPTAYEAEIDNRTTNPAEVTVNVVIPVNVQTAVNAWTR